MKLIWADEALVDLSRIFEFNAGRSEGFARRVDRRLIDRVQSLIAQPRLGRPLRRADTFRLSVTDIQYVIDYEVANDHIRIARIQSSREVL